MFAEGRILTYYSQKPKRRLGGHWLKKMSLRNKDEAKYVIFLNEATPKD